jgi:hypothetical protein
MRHPPPGSFAASPDHRHDGVDGRPPGNFQPRTGGPTGHTGSFLVMGPTRFLSHVLAHATTADLAVPAYWFRIGVRCCRSE